MFLLLLRLLLAFSPAYIHPDEYFQNSEVAASLVGHIQRDLTWEWQLPDPVRSIVPVALTTGWPFFLADSFCLYITGKPASGRVLFIVQRFVFFCLSLSIDYAVGQLARRRRLASFLVQSSGLMGTFILHTFSNSLEASLVGLSLVLLKKIDRKLNKRFASSPDKLLFSFAALLVFGIWNRFTFVIFVFIAGLALITSVVRSRVNQVKNTVELIRAMYPAVFGGLLTVFVLVAMDTLYFHKLVVTPLNAARFNLSHAGEYGVHPVWLHFLVNMPLLYLPYLFGFGCTLYNIKYCKDIILQSSVAYIVLTLVILSTNPHKEARFLVSLIVPFILLAASAVPHRPLLYKVGKFVIVCHAIFLVLVYGGFHQVGSSQAALKFNRELTIPNTYISSKCMQGIEIIHLRSYWLPSHLLFSGAISECQNTIEVSFYPSGTVEDFVIKISEEAKAPNRYVIAPVWYIANQSVEESLNNSGLHLEPLFETYFGPQFDFDELQNIYQAGVRKAWLRWYQVNKIT